MIALVFVAAMPKSVAVVPLQVKGSLPKSIATVLDDFVLAGVQKGLSGVRVVGQGDIEAMLGVEKKKDALGCSSAACIAEIGGALGVDSIIYGSAAKLGKKYTLSLNWIMQRDGAVVQRFSGGIGDSEDALEDGVAQAVAELVGAKTTAAPPPTPTAAASPGMKRVPAFGDFKSFEIDAHEVTVGEYVACVKANACSKPFDTAYWPNITADESNTFNPLCSGLRDEKKNYPVTCVVHAQADAYCRWAKKRLPTENEWQLAAAGVDGRMYPWGNDPPSHTLYNGCGSECVCAQHWQRPPQYAGNDGYSGTAPVGSFPAGRSPYGVDDMAGNVKEMVADMNGANFVGRGQSFCMFVPPSAKISERWFVEPDNRSPDMGFRCAR